MGHMIAFGIIAIIGGFTQIVGMTPGGPSSEYGKGVVFTGICAVVWAALVKIASFT